MSTYTAWVSKIKKGDVVRVVNGWNDGRVEGGRVSRGTVVRLWDYLIVVSYRQFAGSRKKTTEGFDRKSGSSGPYAYLVPVNRDVGYDPEIGAVFAPFGTIHGKRRKKEEQVNVVDVPKGHLLTIYTEGKLSQSIWGPMMLRIRKARR